MGIPNCPCDSQHSVLYGTPASQAHLGTAKLHCGEGKFVAVPWSVNGRCGKAMENGLPMVGKRARKWKTMGHFEIFFGVGSWAALMESDQHKQKWQHSDSCIMWLQQ